MKVIYLTQAQIALVDDRDFELLNKRKWCILKSGRDFPYAVRWEWNKEYKRSFLILMHRAIMDLNYGDKKQVDHINGNGLDNRRTNLRICTITQNRRNSAPFIGTSKYKGVSWSNHKKKWRVQIFYGGRLKHLGYFDIEEIAAQIYNNAALKHFGEFARLNKINYL